MKKLLYLLGITFAILFVYHYPDVFSLYHVPEDHVYLFQNSFFDPWDVNLYVSAIRFGQTGGILLPNLYTTIPNQPVYIYTVLTLLGSFLKSSNPFYVFHWSAFFAGVILIFGMHYSLCELGFKKSKALFLIALISLGGGFGFLTAVAADISSSAFTFYSTFQKPHEALAIAGYIMSFSLFYSLSRGKKVNLKKLLLLVFSLCVCLFIYPYFAIPFVLSGGLFICFGNKTKRVKLFGILSLITAPALIISIFSYSQFVKNPTFGNVGSNLTLDPVSIVLGYGILLPLFVFYLLVVPKSKLGIFLSIWAASVLVLAFFPFGPGKIFLRGSFFPLCTIAFISIESFVSKIKHINRYVVYVIFLVLLTATSFSIFYSRIQNSYTENPWTYMSANEYAVLQFLNNQTPAGSGVLTYYRLSNQIPAYTNDRVYFGHLLQTPNGSEKTNEAARFVSGEGNINVKMDFLIKNNIDFIIWGPEEEALYEKSKKNGNSVKDLLAAFPVVYKNADFEVFSTGSY